MILHFDILLLVFRNCMLARLIVSILFRGLFRREENQIIHNALDDKIQISNKSLDVAQF